MTIDIARARQFVLFSILLSIVLTVSHRATAATLAGRLSNAKAPVKCSALFTRIRTVNFKELFDRKGFLMEKISISRTDYDRGIIFTISYGGESAGALRAEKLRGEFMSHVHVDPKFRGGGFGLLLYVVAAKELYVTLGHPLRSSEAPEPPAERMWQMFVQNGWARGAEVPYQFIPEVLESQFNDVLSFIVHN